jgi:NTE family protein
VLQVADRHASPDDQTRVGVVLSAGGLRGVAHLGVLRQVLKLGVPIDVLVGVSAGAIIAGYYAGVGLTIEDMIDDAPAFKGRHLVAHGLTLRVPSPLRALLRPFCGVIPRRLAQLEAGRFTTLHHGISHLGIVCHDLVANGPVYFSSLDCDGVALSAVVKASAAVPGLFPTRAVRYRDRTVHLVDGGVSDSLPIDFARTALGATRIIVSDCRCVITRPPPDDPHLIYVRADLDGAGSWRSPAGTLTEWVHHGERAVTPAIAQRIRSWRPTAVPQSS